METWDRKEKIKFQQLKSQIKVIQYFKFYLSLLLQ